MASRFYVYLGGASGPLSKIDIPTTNGGMTDIYDAHRPDLRVPESQDGRPFARLQSYTYDITIEATWGGPGPNSDERNMQALANHLNRGGFVGFALASGKAFAAVATRAPAVGTTPITHGTNALTAWEAAASLGSGDEVVIEDPFPSCRRDIYTASTASANKVTLSSGTRMDFTRRPLVRERYTFPVLYRPEGSADAVVNIVRPRNGHIYYEFAAELRYSAALVYDLVYGGTGFTPGGATMPGVEEGAAGILRGDTSTSYQIKGVTLESVLRGTRPGIVR